MGRFVDVGADLGSLSQRERRYEARERARIAGYEREKNRERVLQDQEDRDRVMMRERLATWDDAREAEKGREAFYSDRCAVLPALSPRYTH